MNRLGRGFAVSLVIVLAACGGDSGPSGPLIYKDPPSSGKLRLVRDHAATGTAMVLDLVVGDAALTGYTTGFDLPLDPTKVTLGAFTPGTALSPGSAPVAAGALIPATGPLADNLVVALSQKASGTGAVATDTALPVGALLLSVELDLGSAATDGVVFDGQADGFVLTSGGMTDRQGNSVAAPGDVMIGTLTVAR